MAGGCSQPGQAGPSWRFIRHQFSHRWVISAAIAGGPTAQRRAHLGDQFVEAQDAQEASRLLGVLVVAQEAIEGILIVLQQLLFPVQLLGQRQRLGLLPADLRQLLHVAVQDGQKAIPRLAQRRGCHSSSGCSSEGESRCRPMPGSGSPVRSMDRARLETPGSRPVPPRSGRR